MIRLALLLLGTRYVRSRWVTIVVIGVLWGCVGLAIFVDALADVRVFPLHIFGYVFIVEGVVLFLGAARKLLPGNPFRFVRSFVIIVIGALILAGGGVDDLILAMLFGIAFLISGVFRIASANLLRYIGWQAFLAAGVLEVLFAIFILEPYPTRYHGTLPYCIGAAFMIASLALVRIAMQLRSMPESALLALLSEREHFAISPAWLETSKDRRDACPELTVHVWTPIGAAQDPLHRPVIDRYIAAIDRKGVISTGHASLEVSPDLYISLYPANDIDHSANDFSRLFRATPDNNVRGRFLPSYHQESAEWCESTVKVHFAHYNLAALQAFWSGYQLDTTYNLTNRNCSTTVAHALETALEGTLGDRTPAWIALLRVLLRWEFWVAGEIRLRAEAMAWTPGLVLDYARALEGILHPPSIADSRKARWHETQPAASDRSTTRSE